MKKILVPTDGSDCARLAINQAGELAGFYNARVVLLNVYDMPTMRAYFDFSNDQREADVMEELRRRSERVLAEGRNLLADLGDDRIELVSLEGDPAERIVDYACNSNNGIDMVVIGSYGMSAMRRIFLGSVAHKVIVQVNKPILVMSEHG